MGLNFARTKATFSTRAKGGFGYYAIAN